MKKYLIVISSLLILSSCGKLIKVDLDEAEPKLVIYGSYMHHVNQLSVSVLKTRAFDGPLNNVIKEGVTIKLKNQDDKVMASNGDGSEVTEIKYESPIKTDLERDDSGSNSSGWGAEIKLDEDKDYTLEVTYEGETYYSTSHLYNPIDLIKASAEIIEHDSAKLSFKDPDTEKNNYYRVKFLPNYSRTMKIFGEDREESQLREYAGLDIYNDVGQIKRDIMEISIKRSNTFKTKDYVIAVTEIDPEGFYYLKNLSVIVNPPGVFSFELSDQSKPRSLSAPGNPQYMWRRRSDDSVSDVLGFFSCTNYDVRVVEKKGAK